VFGAPKRPCQHCGAMFRPRVADQRFCRPFCRTECKKLEAKSARRVWAEHGRKLIRDDSDLRYRSERRQG
jgi:hypothetical protein